MSKKRTSTEASNDEQTNEEDSDEAFQQVDNAKRGKFSSFSDTTLQDIPIEILQCILIKAITMEVKNMKLAKSVWKEKADLVISRLGSVCSQWSSVLTTDFFRIELHQALDGIVQEKIRMEMLQCLRVCSFVLTVATLKDEMFMFCLLTDQVDMTPATYSAYKITVYDRNNMAEVKDVIALPGISRGSMAACKISNCLYVLDMSSNHDLHCSSILRIARDGEHKFNIQTWINDLKFPFSSCCLSVSDKGNLIITSRPYGSVSHVAKVYNAGGLLQQEVSLSPDIYGFACRPFDSSVIERSNGNLVLALDMGWQNKMVLREIDTYGIIQRQYHSSFNQLSCMNFADTSGRILIYDWDNRIELLDSELNLLEFTGLQKDQDDHDFFHSLHFNSERNEVIVGCNVDADLTVMKVFRFTEE